MKRFLHYLLGGFRSIAEGVLILYRGVMMAYHGLMIAYCEVYIWSVAFIYRIDKKQVNYLKKLGARRAEWKWAQKER